MKFRLVGNILSYDNHVIWKQCKWWIVSLGAPRLWLSHENYNLMTYTLPVFPRMSRNRAIYLFTWTLLACYRNANRIKYFRIFELIMNLTITIHYINMWGFIFKIIQLVQKHETSFWWSQTNYILTMNNKTWFRNVNPYITQGLFTGFTKRK